MNLISFSRKDQLVYLSLATGLLLSASWPARGFPLLAFIAFVPLFFVEDHLFSSRGQNRSIRFFLFAWLAFFVWNLLTTWWIFMATIPGMITAVIFNSFLMAIPWWLMHVWRRLHSGRQGILPIVVFWLSFEYLHSKWELSWSWLDLGNVFASRSPWVQWYEYTGTAGGALWLLLINILLFIIIRELLQTGRFAKRISWLSSIAVLLFLLPLSISFLIFSRYEEDPDPVEIVIIQPSESSLLGLEGIELNKEVAARLMKMTDMAQEMITSKTRFIVAPEAAMPQSFWLHQYSTDPGVLHIKDFLEDYPGLSWVTGSVTFRTYPNEKEASSTAKYSKTDDNYWDIFNSALIIGPEDLFDYYHKSKLVPGAEMMPFYKLLKPIGRLVAYFGGSSGSMGIQDQRSVFQIAENEPVIAPVICYESIYGDYMTEYIQRGATMIFILTNDSWWGNTPGYRQHHEYSRLRAIEMRRPVIRAASTGFSSFIDQKGQVSQKTDWYEITAIRETVNQNHHLTYFALQGNVVGKISLFLSLLLLLAIISKALILGRNKSTL